MKKEEDSQLALYRFQPMTVKEILHQSMLLYRENFLKLVGIAAPGGVISGLIFQSLWIYRYTEVEALYVVEAAMFNVSIIAFQSFIVTAAGVIAVSEYFLGQSIRVGEAYSRILNYLFPLLGALTLFTVAVTVGLTVLILGIVLYVWFSLAAPVIMMEGEGGFGALKRSRVIVKGDFNKTFLVIVLFTIIQAAAATLLLSLPQRIGAPTPLFFLVSPLAICIPLLIEPFKTVSTTLLYYDLRVRKEGYNRAMMAEELAASSRF